GAKITVNAPQVVVAAGALESPAVLLRSGIGGQATGKYLHLHPISAAAGFYADDQRAWWGAPQEMFVDEFADLEDGFGFLIGGVQFMPGVFGTSLPWRGGVDHKKLVSELRKAAVFMAVTRDRGHGRVEIDPASGESIVHYSVEDPLDRKHCYRAMREMIRLHEAAGAERVVLFADAIPFWERGDDVDQYMERVEEVALAAGGHSLFSAHQMGTCRMGADPASSVADPNGELHDTRGVWIGDGSAFPTSSGT